MTTTNRPYPGMVDKGVEFFVVEDEEMMIQGGRITGFDEAPYSILLLLKEKIESEPETKEQLMQMHPGSEHKRIKQFARCRFGGLDHHPDIRSGELQEGEYWPCPLRGSCSGEGIICRMPKYNQTVLSNDDVSLMKLISSTLTNEQIAERVRLPYGTFHKVKQALYDKLGGIQTKQEVAMIAIQLNII